MISETTRSRLSDMFVRVTAPFHHRDATPEDSLSEPADTMPDGEWVDDDWDEGRRRVRIITVSLLIALISGTLISVWLGSSPRTVVMPPKDAPQGQPAVAADSPATVETVASPSTTGVQNEPREATSPAGTREIPAGDAGVRPGLSSPTGPAAVEGPSRQPGAPVTASPARPRPLDATVRSADGKRSASDAPSVAPSTDAGPRGPVTNDASPRDIGQARASDRQLDGSDIIDWLVKESPHRR
jgi:hypothetical protein